MAKTNSNTISSPLSKAQSQRVKNIDPLYNPNKAIPSGTPPTGSTSKMSRPMSQGKAVKSTTSWGTSTRGGGTTIPPTGPNK